MIQDTWSVFLPFLKQYDIFWSSTISYVYNPYLFWNFISTLQLLDLKLLQSSHFEDASKEFSYDFMKKSDDVFSPTCRSPVLPFILSHHTLRSTMSCGHCHHTSAGCFCLLPLTIISHNFLLKTIFIQLSLLSSRYHHLLLNTTANPTLILRSRYDRMSWGEAISYSLHLFLRCSFKVALRLHILFFNNIRCVDETTILTLCKNFMISSLPFSSFS